MVSLSFCAVVVIVALSRRSRLFRSWTLVVEVVADQSPAVALFQGLGFEPEALLRDHVRDRSGDLRDLMVLAHHVMERWADLATIGIAADA